MTEDTRRERPVYVLQRIHSVGEIETCGKALIREASWSCRRKPEAWAYMGYVDGEGLWVRMVCRETDPRRIYTKHRDPVWKDSAMEVFLAFPKKGEKLSNHTLYLNFEINANGALFAQRGTGRSDRVFVPERVYAECGCRAWIEGELWKAQLLAPEWYLKEGCGWEYRAGDGQVMPPFYCNFYKISEAPDIEHYLSYSRIESEVPNFHLPLWFAEVADETF